MNTSLGLGLLGCGNVGAAFVELVLCQREIFRKRHGIDPVIHKIAVASLEKKRPEFVVSDLLTTRYEEVVDHPEVHTVIEIIGGAGVAYEAAKRALNAGKNLVTANKTLMAEHGPELMDLAHQNGVQLRFEGAVGGGVPVIGALSSGLSANNIRSVVAILNGTTNFILSRMSLEGMSYREALKEAQKRGYAEPDPTFDVTGRDAAQKLAILAALAFGMNAREAQIPTEGITDITPEDIDAAARFDYRIRLLALARVRDGHVELRVNPGMVPNGHFLATIEDEFNAFLVDGDSTGEVVLVGRGAGAKPTAAAVLADVTEIALRTVGFHTNPTFTWQWGEHQLLPPEDVETGYFLRFPILNKPGVIGRIATVLGSHGINIDSASARQIPGHPEWGIVEILSSRAREGSMIEALQALERQTDMLRGQPRMIRIEEWRPVTGYL